jgi:hypothetical protein
MKAKNTKPFQKKLVLKKELLRQLTGNELKAVVGGEPTQDCTYTCRLTE